MIPFTDEQLNYIWDNADIEPLTKLSSRRIDKKLEGFTIIGAEVIDYPKTDGLILHMRRPDGKLYALETGACEWATADGESPFYIYMREMIDQNDKNNTKGGAKQ